MYKLFFNNAEFESYAVSHVLEQAKEAICAIRQEWRTLSEQDEGLTLAGLNKAGVKVVDPITLSFLAEQLMKMGKMNLNNHSDTLI